MTLPMTITDHAGSDGYAALSALIARMTGDEKHTPSAASTLDVLWVLYDRILRVDPAAPDDPDRDRFLLSKGHGPMAYYAVLAAKGFIEPATLGTFAPLRLALRHPSRSNPDPRGRDLERLARARPPDRGRGGARPPGIRSRSSTGVLPARRRRAGRGQQPRGHRIGRPSRPRSAHGRGRRQRLCFARLAGRHRGTVRG